MAILKSAKSLDAIKEELLSSLAARLNTKKTALSNRLLKDKSKEVIGMLEDINTARAHRTAFVDVYKAVTMFEKKRTRKQATAVGDKIHSMRAAGVTIDMLPTCLNAFSTYSRVFTSSCDQKWQESIRGLRWLRSRRRAEGSLNVFVSSLSCVSCQHIV